MRKLLQLHIIGLLLLSLKGISQNVYYDALNLKDNLAITHPSDIVKTIELEPKGANEILEMVNLFSLYLESSDRIMFDKSNRIIENQIQYLEDLREIFDTAGVEMKDSINQLLIKGLDSLSSNTNKLYDEFKFTFKNYNNPFISMAPYHRDERELAPSGDKMGLLEKSITSVAGLDVTTLSQGLSQFMIERAKRELNVAFFEKFKKFANENDEIQYLFPVTTHRLSYLLSYQYTEMLTQLREGFYEDLSKLPDNTIKFLEESDDFQSFRENNPEFWLAINSIKLFRQLEFLSPPEFVAQLSSLTNDIPSPSQDIKNLETMLVLTGIISESVRDKDNDRNWVSADDFYRNVLKDSVTLKLYMGLVYQQIKNKEIKVNKELVHEKILNNKQEIRWYTSRISEFIYLANKVDVAHQEIIKLQEVDTVKIDHSKIHAYFNTLLEIAEFGNKFTEKYGANSYETYLDYASNANDIYKYTYQGMYSSAIMASVELFEKLTKYQKEIDLEAKEIYKKNQAWINENIDLVLIGEERPKDVKFIVLNESNKHVKKLNQHNTLTKQTQKLNKSILDLYDLYSQEREMYNAVNESSKEELLTKMRKSINGKIDTLVDNQKFYKNKSESNWYRKFVTYGTFMANMVEADSPEKVAEVLEATALPVGSSSIKKNSKFNVAIYGYLGVSLFNVKGNNDSLNKVWHSGVTLTAPVGVAFSKALPKKFGSVSATAVLLDVGAIVDYQLKNDSVITSTISLDNIFSPGINISYGVGWNIPISIGYSLQYGPGLVGIEHSDRTIVNPPGIRHSMTILVDIPIINLYNSPRKR